MMNDDALLALLDVDAERAIHKIKSSHTITIEEAMPLLLKSQFNHIAHLDQALSAIQETMATKDDLKRIDAKFERIDEKFERIDAQFEKIDTRFEMIDQKFDAIDKRFETIDKKFDAIDTRFEKIDSRFDVVDSKFEKVQDRMMTMLYTIIGTMIALTSVTLAVMKL